MSKHSIESSHGLKKWLPPLEWFPLYSSNWIRSDLGAGITTAAAIIPQSLAFATIAGLPVEMGLYTPLVLMVVYAILGTSRVLMVSTTSTISLLTAATLLPVIQNNEPSLYLTAATTLAFLVGIFLILAGVLRLGILANLISLPVLTGFKAGIGVVIIVRQIAKAIGVSIENAPFLKTVVALLLSIDDIHWATFSLALVTLAILIFFPRVTGKIPAPLVAIVLSVLAAALLNLESLGVALVGEFPSGLPSPTLPDLDLISQLWPGALGIALMSLIESIAAGRSFTQKGEPTINANQELVALGVANAAGGFLQAYPGSGGISITAVNRRAGAKSQISGLIVVAIIALTLLFLTRFVALIPQAALGAMIIVASARLISLKDFRAIYHNRYTEFVWAVVAFAGVVLLGTLEGILIAVAISISTILLQASFPPVYELGRKNGTTDVFRPLSPDHPEDETFPGLLIVRGEGRLNFFTAPNTADKVRTLIQEAEPQVVVIDFSGIPNIEYTTLTRLAEVEEEMRAEGITLWWQH
jgi:high affinity sulfate transporter 1